MTTSRTAPQTAPQTPPRPTPRPTPRPAEPRLVLTEAAPEAYQAMLGLETYLRESPLPARVRELVALRVSQINGCTFCVAIHGRQARESGIAQQALDALEQWPGSPHLQAGEQAALALAEAATALGREGVPEELWRSAAEHYDEPQLAALVMAVATVNAWNRIALATGLSAPA